METYFARTELPMQLWQDEGQWVLGWEKDGYGERVSFADRPNRTVRKLVHKLFVDDYRLALEHGK